MASVTKPSAAMVARFIIAFANNAGELITNLKLQKLLYFAQGFYLAHYGQPLFDQKFQAWAHGPVIPSVYRAYKKGWLPINHDVEKPKFGDVVEKWLRRFLSVYMPLDAFALERMAHSTTPWQEARGNLPIDARCEREISEVSMKNYFRQLVDGQQA